MSAQAWQRLGERRKARELHIVADDVPIGMVAILFARLGVTAGCLNMAIRICGYPHVGPGRGNGKRPDALEGRDIGDPASVRREIEEASPGPASVDPGLGVADIAKA